MSEADLNVQVNIVDGGDGDGDGDHDPHYDPIISLPEVAVSTNEEDEIELIKLRAKLYRYDTSENPPEWKERGTGDVKLLRHQTKNTVRVVMRRDKTLKICANHFVTPNMELKPNCGSDRAWVWSALADYTNETAQTELLAIRFANADNAKKWKEMFEEAKTIVATKCDLYTKVPDDLKEEETESSGSDEENDVEESLQNLNLNETQPEKKDSEKEKSPTKEEPVDK
ncbi:ran-specific GTPase-activating protein-like isoform X2 [Homalodisca vitripennis]|uniref:ran-specific GTPase-activating protein-like isoform X2 n=1 Tax=Homalodisca vitripennis TaxID=197043 RepID=UPI001EEC6D11|nr:ran-specific GTPase-activating protein-like isoform X2 [Homalodisca vitripennis]